MKRFKTVYLVLVGLLIGGAMSSALASDNFGELNVKAGVNLCTGLNLKSTDTNFEDDKSEFVSKPCASFAGEFLIPAEHLVSSLDFLKFGVGLKYLTSAKTIPVIVVDERPLKLSYLPIYFTLQINPFVRSNEESLKGLFVKGDIGYNAYFSSNLKKAYEAYNNGKDKRGLYYAFGAGYEFPFGVVFDITYGVYKSSIEWNSNDSESYKRKLTNSCVSLNVGYKFKI